MDFPVFHLDFFGNRMLIAVIAVLHVVVNHACAVGAMPLVTSMEWFGFRRGEPEWDRLAHRLLFVFFVITTSVGALTGVGIWFSAALVNPNAIGSLIRVFFWVWFIEWIVFVSEVILILAYYLLWPKWTGDRKVWHIRLGVVLSVASWLTMVLIVGILAFKMDPGLWRVDRTLGSAYFNPVFLPQLLFRTPMAMVMAGAAVLFLIPFLTKDDAALRARATRFASLWMLAWAPVLALGSLWYHRVIPSLMAANIPVALTTVQFQALYGKILWFIALSLGALVLASLAGILRPGRVPALAWVVPAVLVVILTGQFERTREFVRKPYVLGGYMYANGIRVEEYPLLAKEGLLARSSYAAVRRVEPGREAEAGREVFRLACTRCHTLHGVNALPDRLRILYGPGPWDAGVIDRYLATIHGARPFMPPVPGTAQERAALAAYLAGLSANPDWMEGAQTAGLPVGNP